MPDLPTIGGDEDPREPAKPFGQAGPDPGSPASSADATVVGDGASSAGSAAPASSSGAPRTRVQLEKPGDVIGPFRLVKELGAGGFGVVWLAERKVPYEQKVALKLINPGMDSSTVLGRFEQERQALAIMNHPNVAKVLDGGVTDMGRPYFAMEYVKGEPMNEYCDSRKLDLRARLELFIQVCEAVQHAHTKGLIHRDLKPGNVLVAAGEGDRPTAKVIDFGIAKALNTRMSEHTVMTETGQMIGTPEYMSPEQADPDATDIDTRSDVYSLGVMLYELLVGALPFEPKELRSRAYREIQRIIREEDPPTPSRRLSTFATKDAGSASKIAEARRSRIDEIAQTLKNELEWIPLKAMRKERDQRYASPNDLAADLRNYLGGLPLVAAPESKAYKVRKFVRRNRALVYAATAVAASLAIGAVVSTVFAIAEARQRELAEQAALAEKAARDQAEALAKAERAAKERAEQRERDVKAVLGQQVRLTSEFGGGDTGSRMAAELMRQIDALSQTLADPAQRTAMQQSFRDALLRINMTDVAATLVTEIMLERAIARASTEHANDPFVRAGLIMAAGRAYQQLGRTERAEELFRQARDLYGAQLGPDDRRTMLASQWFARVRRDRAEAERGLREVLARLTALHGEADVDTVECRRLLAAFLEEKGDRRAALAEYQSVLAQPSLTPDIRSGTMSAVGDLQRAGGDLDEAIATLRQARTEIERLQPVPDRLLSNVLTNLGLALADPSTPQSQAEGIALLRKAIAIDSAFYGDAHPLSFDSRANLAATLELIDDGSGSSIAEAIRVFDENRRVGSSLVAPPDEHLLSLMESAMLMAKTAPADEAAARPVLADAVKLGEDALRVADQRRIADAARWRDFRKTMAFIYARAGRFADAERLQRQVRDLWLAAGEPTAIPVFNITKDLAGALVAQGRLGEAVDLLQAMQDAKPSRAPTSDARWVNAIMLRDLLREQASRELAGPAKARLVQQDAEVATLRKAREAAGLGVDLDAPVAPEPAPDPAQP
ncbi:MAG: hypothetical protein FJ270_04165 [Planctomycetes bacterium]|nr:hypothetical protein [Planctomycetota bacterium]